MNFPDPPVFAPVNLNVDKWPYAYHFYQAAYQGDWTEAKRLWDTAPVTGPGKTAITDVIGGIEYGWEQSQSGVPVSVDPHGIASSPYDFTYRPGVAVAFAAHVAGAASASAASGDGLYGGVFDTVPASIKLSQFQTWAKDAIQGLAIQPGQFLVLYSEATGERAGRADVRSI